MPSLPEGGFLTYLFILPAEKNHPDKRRDRGTGVSDAGFPGNYSVMNTAAASTVVQSPVLSPWADWAVLVVLMIFPLAL